MNVNYKFTYEELRSLYDILIHQYVDYHKPLAKETLDKIVKIVEQHEKELDRRASNTTLRNGES